MSVYLLAPILLYAAHASDQRFVAERAGAEQKLQCCAPDALRDHPSDFHLGHTESADMASTSASEPMLWEGHGQSAGSARDPRLALATAPTPDAEISIASPAPEASAQAQNAEPPALDDDYSFRLFRDQAKSIKWRFAGAAAAITLTGFANWNWGSSQFRFNSEGWFGKGTASLGMDKLGHGYTSYVLTEFFTDGIEKRFGHKRSGSYTSAILAMGLMTYIEVFDGFSKDHGFSHEDLLVDAAGALFSVARRSVPGLREKIDFRLLYVPSKSTWGALSCFPKPHCDRDGQAVRSPITDYSGQRYLLALKLSGFETFEHTPLRLLELHGGYYARGFTKEEEDRGEPLKRRLFVGVGLNVSELLFPGPRRGLGGAAKWALQYLQVPYTAIHSN